MEKFLRSITYNYLDLSNKELFFEKINEGLANHVFYIKNKPGFVVKIYSKKQYYKGEIEILTRINFEFKPRLIKHGFYDNKSFAILEYIPTEKFVLTENNLESLNRTIVALHANRLSKITNFKQYFFSVTQERGLLKKHFPSIDVSGYLNNIFKEEDKLKLTQCIIHNDICESNIRFHRNKVYLIDFEEALNTYRILEFAVMYWFILQKRIDLLKKMLEKYSVIDRLKPVEKTLLPKSILLVGLNLWLWRYNNLPKESVLIESMRKNIKNYFKNINLSF